MKRPLAAALLALALPSAPARADEGDDDGPRRYGDRGSSHVGVLLGLGAGGGGVRWAAGGEYGYFVLDGVAPGVEVLATGGTGLLTTGLALATLRLVPVRTDAVSFFLVGRAGRVLLSDHEDGWGVGGGAGVILFMGGRVGLRVGYDRLELLPRRFCADLASGCHLDGLQVGVVAGY